MMVCKFNLGETGCKLGRECTKLHPVDTDLAKREIEAKKTHIICQQYARDTRCGREDCTLLHVSGALGPVLELPKPQRGRPRDTPPRRGPRGEPSRHEPREGHGGFGRNHPGSRHVQSSSRGEARPRIDALRSMDEPHMGYREQASSKPRDDSPGERFAMLGSVREKLRQIIEAHTNIWKYAELTKSEEATLRIAEIEGTLCAVGEGIDTINHMLDLQISMLGGGSTGRNVTSQRLNFFEQMPPTSVTSKAAVLIPDAVAAETIVVEPTETAAKPTKTTVAEPTEIVSVEPATDEAAAETAATVVKTLVPKSPETNNVPPTTIVKRLPAKNTTKSTTSAKSAVAAPARKTPATTPAAKGTIAKNSTGPQVVEELSMDDMLSALSG